MSVVRAVLAVALVLALQVAGLTAPFVHAHPDDDTTGHHDGRAIHAHVAGHAPPPHAPHGRAVESDDHHEGAVYLNAFVAVPAATFATPDVILASFNFPVGLERAAHHPVDVVHAHDPPAFGSLAPRAPPLSLS